MPTWLAFLWFAAGLAAWAWVLRAPADRFGGPPADTPWRFGDAVVAGFLGVFFLSALAGPQTVERVVTRETIQGGLVTYTTMAMLILIFLSVRQLSPTRAFGFFPARPATVVLFAAGAIVATYGAVLASSRALEMLGVSASDNDPMVQYLRGNLAPADKAWFALLALGVAPFAEELIFRGFLYGVLRRHIGPLWAMLSTALLFAAIHDNFAAIPPLFLLAVGFTLAYERTGSLWTPILMHVIFNSLSLVVLLFFPQWADKL